MKKRFIENKKNISIRLCYLLPGHLYDGSEKRDRPAWKTFNCSEGIERQEETFASTGTI